MSGIKIENNPYGIYWENFLSDDDIEKIHSHIKYFDGNTTGKSEIGKGKISNGIINLELRNNDIIWIGEIKETKWLFDKIKNAVSNANNLIYKFELIGAEPFQYSIYDMKEKAHYDWHNDILIDENKHLRKLTMSILLSDTSEYEGGSFLFSPEGKPFEMEQKKGRLILFPSWIPHKINPVIKGKRISLVTWFYGKAFK